VAILSGLVANVVKDSFGIVAPFDTSFLLLMIGSAIIGGTWPENYGDSHSNIKDSLLKAWRELISGLYSPFQLKMSE
jgi:hypothetical protein